MMFKKTLMFAGLWFAASVMAGNVQAGEPSHGQVSQSVLAELGMGDMQPMEEAQAKEVRGKFLINPASVPQINVGFNLPALISQLNSAATVRVSSAIENSPLGPYVDFNPSGFLFP